MSASASSAEQQQQQQQQQQEGEEEEQDKKVRQGTWTSDNNASPLPQEERSPKILVLGSCGLDRLLTVPYYPPADAKIRTTSYHEIGGGNAANTATAMARVLPAQAWAVDAAAAKGQPAPHRPPIRVVVQLATIVGDDAAGHTLVQSLVESGVDLSSPLFYQKPDTTTGVTVIIVSESEFTRTCFHTPGTCGEWSPLDLMTTTTSPAAAQGNHGTNEKAKTTTDNGGDDDDDKMSKNRLTPRMKYDAIFDQVLHFHSDARHTDVALELAKEAQRRNIPISLDVEKDRNSKSLDELLSYANIVFTNDAHPMDLYLDKLNRQRELEHEQLPWPAPTIVSSAPPPKTTATTTTASNTLATVDMKFYARVIKPSIYFTRWYHQVGKQVVVTKGAMGAVHVLCESIQTMPVDDDDDDVDDRNNNTRDHWNQIVVSQIDPNNIAGHQSAMSSNKNPMIRIEHHYVERSSSSTSSSTVDATTASSCTSSSTGQDEMQSSSLLTRRKVSATYLVQTQGVLSNVSIVDTTGAGDALIGGYLAMSTITKVPADCLAFGSWVAGCKLEGPGAQTALPKAEKVNQNLGHDPASVLSSLHRLLMPFKAPSLSTAETTFPPPSATTNSK